MKGSGTPMKHRRTHIPRFCTMLVGHFLNVEPSELNTNIQYTHDVNASSLSRNACAKVQIIFGFTSGKGAKT